MQVVVKSDNHCLSLFIYMAFVFSKFQLKWDMSTLFPLQAFFFKVSLQEYFEIQKYLFPG